MKLTIGGALLVAAMIVSGCSATPDTHADTTKAAAQAAQRVTAHQHPKAASPARRPVAKGRPGAAAVLASLRVKGRSPMTGYSREQFGPAWLDANRNGCDTRNDVLRRDLTRRIVKPGTDGCVILRGTLVDRYTHRTIRFVRAGAYANELDIDHVVALGNAWVSGASRWNIRQRAALANDPMNLLVVDPSANRQKGDGDAATWLPAYQPFRCRYVARQIAVKDKFRLSVAPAEKAAMLRILAACPGQPVPPNSGAPTTVNQNIQPPPPPQGSKHPTELAGGSVSYANCTAVRAAGAAPIRRGQPGYSTKLDRDGDGIACE
jgi:hypothetical protein